MPDLSSGRQDPRAGGGGTVRTPSVRPAAGSTPAPAPARRPPRSPSYIRPPNPVARLFGSEATRNLILKVWPWRWEAGAVTVEKRTDGSSPARGWMEAGVGTVRGVGTVGGRDGSPGKGRGRPGRWPPALATG